MVTVPLDARKKRTALLVSLYHSCYQRTLYLEVYQKWRYRIFCLLLLLAALSCLNGFIQPLDSIQAFRHNSHKIASQLPTLHFEHYQLSIDQASPYFVKTTSHGSVLIVFDTSADPKTLAAYQPMLLTFGADGFYIHNLNQHSNQPVFNFHRYDQYHLIHLDHLILTPQELMGYLNDLIIVAQLCLYALSVMATFIEYLLITCFLGLAIMVIAITHKLHLSKGGAFRLGAVALIPATAWFFVTGFFSKTENAWLSFIGFSIAFGYCLFAVKILKKNQPSIMEPS